jgi:hypothetical protein
MMKVLFLFINLSFIITTVQSQTTAIDTVNLARSIAYDKKFSEANDLLKIYNTNNKDQYAIQLQAQILYWIKDFKKAEQLYESGIAIFPDFSALKLDYARMLYQLNKTERAKILFSDYLSVDAKNAEANISLAWIDLHDGQIASAKQRAQNIISNFPGNLEAENILFTIQELTAPYLKLRAGAYSDDQPLKQSFVEPEIGVYRSWLISPYVKASFNQQNTTQSFATQWISAGNKIFLAATKTNIELAAGYFQGKNYEGDATWKLMLNQKISNNFSADVGTEKKPYQYTIASVENPFLYQVSEAGLNFNKNNRWLGRAAFQSQHFEDGNTVSTFYGWLLAPLVEKNGFSLKAGYSFSYADSDNNTFIPKTTFAPPFIPSNEVEGIFDPYFTPKEQYINAALVSLGVPLSTSVGFTTRASIGFYARASQPVLFVDSDGSGSLFINKTFGDLNYTPVEIFSELNFKFSRKFYVAANYTYNSLIFFKSNSGNIQLKYLFINGKRK